MQTNRKPISVGEMLNEEFLIPMALTQTQLAQAMGVQRRLINEICNNKRAITVATALMLGRFFGNSAEFWLNLQLRNDMWEELNSPKTIERLEKVRPLKAA